MALASHISNRTNNSTFKNPKSTQLQSKTGETALHVALSQRRLNLDVLEMLMEQGPQACKAQDKYGNSPLHKACR